VTSDRIFRGLALRLLAMFCMSSMSALIKLVETRHVSLVETMFHRQLWSIPLVMVWVAIGPDGLGALKTQRFNAHVSRTLVGLLGMVFTFGSVLLLPLAEATTFQFTVPIFATLLGALVLREKTGWHRWAAVLVGFVGVMIVAHPSSANFDAKGTMVGLLAALFVAIVAILLRQIGKTESAGTTVFWFSALSVVILLPFYALQMKAHDPVTWALMVAIGLTGGVGQLALTGAVRFAPVSAVVPMDYSSLIWGTLYGWLLFGAWPTRYTWAGAPIIIVSGLYIVWRERVRQIEQTSSASDAPMA